METHALKRPAQILDPTLDELILQGLSKTDEELCILLHDWSKEFGAEKLANWRHFGKHDNTLLHLVASSWKTESLKVLLKMEYVDVNVQRSSDMNTTLHLVALKGRRDLYNFLVSVGADETLINKYNENAATVMNRMEKGKEMTTITKSPLSVAEKYSESNIIFLDLELTNLISDGIPKILECAVIITDSDLREIERGQWVIHFEREELNSLNDWCKKTFAAVIEKGNGLFDACVASTTTMTRFEKELLELLAKWCPLKKCPLGGYSVHCDLEVLGALCSSVFDFVSNDIIDVSTFLSLGRRWLPHIIKRKDVAAEKIRVESSHRAMFDVEDSIRTMKWARGNYLQLSLQGPKLSI